MFNEQETSFQCPYRAQWISFLLEDLYGGQSYIEDCEVCCQPIQITYIVEDGEIKITRIERAD